MRVTDNFISEIETLIEHGDYWVAVNLVQSTIPGTGFGAAQQFVDDTVQMMEMNGLLSVSIYGTVTWTDGTNYYGEALADA